jgi:hypothetical protein
MKRLHRHNAAALFAGALLLVSPVMAHPVAAGAGWARVPRDPRMDSGHRDLAISRNGQVLVWTAVIGTDPRSAVQHVFAYDRRTRRTEIVSVSTNGRPGNAGSGWPSVSDDGRFIAFTSFATDLMPDSNGSPDVFLRDRLAHRTTMVSGRPGRQYTAWSQFPQISGDGSFIVYTICAVPNDGHCALHGYQPQTRQTTTITDTHSGNSYTELSRDGRFVVYPSHDALTDDDRRADDRDYCLPDLYLRDIASGQVTLLTGGLSVLESYCGRSYARFDRPRLDAAGHCVAFAAHDDTTPYEFAGWHVWLYTARTSTRTEVRGNLPVNGQRVADVKVSADCSHVYLITSPDPDGDLTADPSRQALYRWTASTGQVERLSPDVPTLRSTPNTTNGTVPDVLDVAVSADESVIAMTTTVGFDPDDTDSLTDIYLRTS